MKKFLLLTILCLALSSCESRTAPDPFSGDFSCEVAFALGDTEYAIAYARDGGRETARILAPTTLAGLTAVREGGEVTLSCGDVSFTALAADGIFDFAALLRPRELTRLADGCYGTEGYTLYTDGEGLPLRIESGRYDLRLITFKGDEAQ